MSTTAPLQPDAVAPSELAGSPHPVVAPSPPNVDTEAKEQAPALPAQPVEPQEATDEPRLDNVSATGTVSDEIREGTGPDKAEETATEETAHGASVPELREESGGTSPDGEAPERRRPPADEVDDLDDLLGIAPEEREVEADERVAADAETGKARAVAAAAAAAAAAAVAAAVSSSPRKKLILDPGIQGLLAARVAIYWILGVGYFVGFLFISQVLTYREIPIGRHLAHFFKDSVHWGPILALLTPLVIFDLLRATQRMVLPVIQVREQLVNMLEGKEVSPVTTAESGCMGELVEVFEQLRTSGAGEYLAAAVQRREADQLLDSMKNSPSNPQFKDALIN